MNSKIGTVLLSLVALLLVFTVACRSSIDKVTLTPVPQQTAAVEATSTPAPTVEITPIEIGETTPKPTITPSPTPAATQSATPTVTPTIQEPTKIPPQTSVVISPSNVTPIKIGETITLEVRVIDVTSLYGVELHMTFDPAGLEVADSIPDKAGVQLEAGKFLDPAKGWLYLNGADNLKGTADYIFTLMGQTEPVSGSGTLCNIKVKLLKAGRYNFDFSAVILAGLYQGKVEKIEAKVTGTAINSSQPAVTPTATLCPP